MIKSSRFGFINFLLSNFYYYYSVVIYLRKLYLFCEYFGLCHDIKLVTYFILWFQLSLTIFRVWNYYCGTMIQDFINIMLKLQLTTRTGRWLLTKEMKNVNPGKLSILQKCRLSTLELLELIIQRIQLVIFLLRYLNIFVFIFLVLSSYAFWMSSWKRLKMHITYVITITKFV